jgi:hypothetical protein
MTGNLCIYKWRKLLDCFQPSFCNVLSHKINCGLDLKEVGAGAILREKSHHFEEGIQISYFSHDPLSSTF